MNIFKRHPDIWTGTRKGDIDINSKREIFLIPPVTAWFKLKRELPSYLTKAHLKYEHNLGEIHGSVSSLWSFVQIELVKDPGSEPEGGFYFATLTSYNRTIQELRGEENPWKFRRNRTSMTATFEGRGSSDFKQPSMLLWFHVFSVEPNLQVWSDNHKFLFCSRGIVFDDGFVWCRPPCRSHCKLTTGCLKFSFISLSGSTAQRFVLLMYDIQS